MNILMPGLSADRAFSTGA